MHSKIRFAMLALAAGVFASAAAAAGTISPSAQTLIDNAVDKATAENKAIFVHFSASW
jgi:hypothetical protein